MFFEGEKMWVEDSGEDDEVSCFWDRELEFVEIVFQLDIEMGEKEQEVRRSKEIDKFE